MFRNKRKKSKKFNWKKSQEIMFFLLAPILFFALYTLISSNLQIILKKNYISKLISKRRPSPKIAKNLVVNSRNGTLTKIQKTPSVLYGLTLG